jgi:hypothetical protein
MTDILQELADQVQKSEGVARPVNRTRSRPVQQQPRADCVKSVGPGGVLFDFGCWTGDPNADRFTTLLHRHADPQQMQIARDQKAEFGKAMNRYVEVGQDRYEREQSNSIDDAAKSWNKQFKGSTDAVISKLHEEGNLTIDSQTSLTKAPPGAASQDFAKSKTNVGGETVTARSETDAAVIEMMNGMKPSEGE